MEIFLIGLIFMMERPREMPKKRAFPIGKTHSVLNKVVKDAERERFVRFFKDHGNVNYTAMSFEKFSDNGFKKFML